MPPLSEQVKEYLEERQKWQDAGNPIRSKEKIRELYKICVECPNYFNTVGIGGRCDICGCLVNLSNKLNKLAWSTVEQCPDNPPRWVDKFKTVEQEKIIGGGNEEKPQTQINESAAIITKTNLGGDCCG